MTGAGPVRREERPECRSHSPFPGLPGLALVLAPSLWQGGSRSLVLFLLCGNAGPLHSPCLLLRAMQAHSRRAGFAQHGMGEAVALRKGAHDLVGFVFSADHEISYLQFFMGRLEIVSGRPE